jgi:ankyrin repeat protein
MTNWVRLFLDNGGDPNIPFAHPEIDSRTPLHLAVEQQTVAIAEMLLTHKADVNGPDDYGQTPLFRAINKADSKMVELLLTNNADTGALNRDGVTPLAKAVEFKNAAIVEQLLEKGANPNVFSLGVPLLQMAIGPPAQTAPGIATYGSGVPYTGVPSGGVVQSLPIRTARPLVNAVPNTPSPSSKSPPKTEKSILELLLQYKADPNIRDNVPEKEHETPLHFAARKGDEIAAKLLLAYKADVNARSDSGTTPLHVAAQSQSSSFVELLLTNKANVNATRNRGETPMHWAAAYSGNTNALSVLVEHGGDINACSHDGDTPLLRFLQTRNMSIGYSPSEFNFIEFMVRLGADVTKTCNGKPSAFEFAVKRGFSDNYVDLLRRFHPAQLSHVRFSGPVQQYTWYFETAKGATLSQAIAAIGLGEKANPRNISVLRDDPKTGLKEQRGYDLVAIRLKDSQDVPLRDGDKIIVAER